LPRIIGLDIGEKRIGIAVSDQTQTIAQALEVLESNTRRLIARLQEMISSHDIEEIVVGLPLNMDGSKGPQAEKAIELAQTLSNSLKIKVTTFDERLTTKQGQDILLQADMSRGKRKANIDKVAAQIMLQAHLDLKKSQDH